MRVSKDNLAFITGRPAAVFSDLFVDALGGVMHRYEINTPLRAAHFLAQLCHESGGFRYPEEIWGPTPHQERYEGRTDLGNVLPGDGYRFRGRGGWPPSPSDPSHGGRPIRPFWNMEHIVPHGVKPLPTSDLQPPTRLEGPIVKALKAIYAYLKGRLTEGDTYAALMGLAAWFQVSPQLAEPALDIIVYLLGALGVLVPQKGEKKDEDKS